MLDQIVKFDKINWFIVPFIAFSMTLGSLQAQTYVSITGSDITGDGSLGNPYFTLEHAADELTASDFSSGPHVIYLMDGIHTNAAAINNTDTSSGNELVITAQSGANPILSNASGGDFLTLQDDHIVISNLVFKGNGNSYALRFVNREHITIIANEISGYGQGILADKSSHLLIQNNVIMSNNDDGIGMNTSFNFTVSNISIISNALLDNSTNGLSADNFLNSSFLSNRILNSGDRGIRLVRSENITIAWNSISNSGGAGILGHSSTKSFFHNNEIFNGGDHGMDLRSDFTESIVSNNLIHGNSFVGIYLYQASNNLLAANQVYSNSRYGVQLNTDAILNVFASNTIYDNTRNEIYLTSASNHFYLNNIHKQNTVSYSLILSDSGSVSNIFELNHLSNAVGTILEAEVSSADTYYSNYFAGTTNLSSILATNNGLTTNDFVPYRLGEIGLNQSDVLPPPIPTFSSVVNSSSNVTLQWTDVGGDVAGYRLYRTTNDTWTNLTTTPTFDLGNVTSYVDTGVVVGVDYYYFLTSYDGQTLENESWYSSSTNGALADMPILAITNPVTNSSGIAIITNSPVTISGWATNIGNLFPIQAVYFGTNASTISDAASGTYVWSTNVDVSGLSGTNYFYAVASNADGITTNILTNIIDLSPPVITITSPSANNTIYGSFDFRGTYTDNLSDITGLYYSYNNVGTWSAAVETNSPWTNTIDTTALVNGEYIFGVRVIDGVGWETILYQTNYVSNSSLTVSSPSTGVIGTNDNIIEGNLSTDLSDINALVMRVSNGATWQSMSTAAPNSWSHAVNITGLVDGSYNFEYGIVYNNGETNISTNAIIVDNTIPTASFSEAGGDYFASVSVTITGTDANGLELVYYTTNGSIPSDINGDTIIVAAPTTVTFTDSVSTSNVLTAYVMDYASNISTNISASYNLSTDVAGNQIKINAISHAPYNPREGVLTIDIKKSQREKVEICILDINMRTQVILSDPTPGKYNSRLSFSGKDARGRYIGRGIYLAVPKVGDKFIMEKLRKIYIVY